MEGESYLSPSPQAGSQMKINHRDETTTPACQKDLLVKVDINPNFPTKTDFQTNK